MLSIRLRRRRAGKVISSSVFEVIVIKKGKAVHSHGQQSVLGTFNKKTNVLLFNYDLFYFWISQGATFSSNAYKLLKSFLF